MSFASFKTSCRSPSYELTLEDINYLFTVAIESLKNYSRALKAFRRFSQRLPISSFSKERGFFPIKNPHDN